MNFLTDGELAQLRGDLLETLPDTCDILRPTSAIGSDGYIDESWGTAVAGAACRFDPVNRHNTQALIAERESAVAIYLVTLAYDTDIRDGDALRYNGSTYQLTNLWEAHSLRAVRRLEVSQIRGE